MDEMKEKEVCYREREDDYYWINIYGKWRIAEYIFWEVGHWQCGSWCGHDDNIDEIDERRITRKAVKWPKRLYNYFKKRFNG